MSSEMTVSHKPWLNKISLTLKVHCPCSRSILPAKIIVSVGRSEIIETITILSKRTERHSKQPTSSYRHQVLNIWGLGLNYLTASFNCYDPVPFLRLIPPLPWSTSHYVDVHCTVSLIYYRLTEQATISSLASKVNLYQ